MAENKLNIRVEMQGEMLERFKKVQALLGIESGTDVFRYLVSDYYHQRAKASAEREIKAPGGLMSTMIMSGSPSATNNTASLV